MERRRNYHTSSAKPRRTKRPPDAGRVFRLPQTLQGEAAHGGGIVLMKASCVNQHSDVVADADGKMLVANKR